MLRISKTVHNICTRNVPIIVFPERSHNTINTDVSDEPKEATKGGSKRLAEFRKKLRETSPIDDLGEQALHSAPIDDPLPAFPNNTNPSTGEIGGPRGVEPTRYGDWERKGRVSDF